MKNNLKKIYNWSTVSCLIAVFSIVAFDRITKLLALNYCQSEPIWFVGSITNHIGVACNTCFNCGVAFGIGNSVTGTTSIGWLIAFTFGVFVCAVLIFLMQRIIRLLSLGKSAWGELLIVAGACANVYDRIIYGSVVDFIMCVFNGFWGTYTFPIFNIADISIVLGACLFFISEIKHSK